MEDLKTQDAVIRNIEIIGEATKKLPDNFRQEYSIIPWKSLAGMRDKLIHDYFGVNFDIVWEVLKRDLPGLEEQITKIIKMPDEHHSGNGVVSCTLLKNTDNRALQPNAIKLNRRKDPF